MATATLTTQEDAGAPPSGPVVTLREATTADILRAYGVTMGPSVVLDALALASFGMAARKLLGRQSGCAASRVLTPLASLGVGLTAAYLTALRPRMRRWGATDKEVRRALPGDELIPDSVIDSTWAVTIDAPVEEVWPWIAQIGQDRGGFYSYAWLENLAGCQLQNADRVHPEWQQRTEGEVIPLHPTVGLRLARFEPGHTLVLNGWGSFVVEPIDEQRTRLITRSRVAPGWSALLYQLVMELPHFIMQRKMLLEIKRLAEEAHQERLEDEAIKLALQPAEDDEDLAPIQLRSADPAATPVTAGTPAASQNGATVPVLSNLSD